MILISCRCDTHHFRWFLHKNLKRSQKSWGYRVAAMLKSASLAMKRCSRPKVAMTSTLLGWELTTLGSTKTLWPGKTVSLWPKKTAPNPGNETMNHIIPVFISWTSCESRLWFASATVGEQTQKLRRLFHTWKGLGSITGRCVDVRASKMKAVQAYERRTLCDSPWFPIWILLNIIDWILPKTDLE